MPETQVIDPNRAFETLQTAALLQAIEEAEPHSEPLEIANLIYGRIQGEQIAFAHFRASDGSLVERAVTSGGESLTATYEDASTGPNLGPLPAIGFDLPELRRHLLTEVFPGKEAEIVAETHVLSRGHWIDFADDDRPVWCAAFRAASGQVFGAFVDAVDGRVLRIESDPAILEPIPVASRGLSGLLKLQVGVKLTWLALMLGSAVINVIGIFGALAVLLAILAEILASLRGALRSKLQVRYRNAESLVEQAKKAAAASNDARAKELGRKALAETREIRRQLREHGILDLDLHDRIQSTDQEIGDLLK